MKSSKLFYTNIDNTIMTPSSIEGSYNIIRTKNSGRSEETGEAHVTKLATKRKYELAWNGIKPEEVAKILHAFGFDNNKVNTVQIHLMDPCTNKMADVKVYTGDSQYSYGPWTDDGINFYNKLSFNVIEI